MNPTSQSQPATADLFEAYVAPTYRRFAVAPVRGRGCWLWDESGNKYLDFGGGIAVSSLGHAHPRIIKAIEQQASALIHCSNLYQIPGQARLAALLTERVMQIPGKVFFCNSGAEANEGIYKLARRYGHLKPKPDGTPRLEMITCHRGFHGRTLAGIAATGQDKVKAGFFPLVPGFKHVPLNDGEALRAAVDGDTVAILLEALQGEGGIHVASPGFLRETAALCREKDLLFCLDEIQCGLGRTGHLRGWETALGADPIDAGVIPDAVGWAKGMGAGYPIGAVWIQRRQVDPSNPSAGDLCDVLGPGSHGTTYGGSPLASAVATAVLEEILEEDLAANAAAMGRIIQDRLRSASIPFVKATRGLGLMVGIVLDVERLASIPAFAESGKPPSIFMAEKLNEARLLTVPAGSDVIRWLPALNVSEAEIETAVFTLKRTFETLASSR